MLFYRRNKPAVKPADNLQNMKEDNMVHNRQFHRLLIYLFILTLIATAAYGRQQSDDIQTPIKQLNSEDSQTCIAAAKELGRLGDKRAVEPLIACLNNTSIKNPFIKSAAAEALGQIGDPRAVEPLIECLKSREFILYRPTIEALDKIGDKRAAEPLSKFLIGGLTNPPDIEAALKSLGKLGDPNAVDEIVTLLKSGHVSEPIRKLAIDTIMKLDSRNGIANLIELWKTSDSFSRRRLSKNLIQAGKPAVGPLIDILTESNIQPNADIRTYMESRLDREKRELYTDTIEILGQTSDPAAAEAIIANLATRDSFVQNTAKKALIKLHTAAVDPLIRFLRKKESENGRFTPYDIRDTAIEILGEIGDPNAVNILIQCLKTDDYSETKAAAKALGQIGDSRAIPHLSRLLQDNDRNIAKTAAEALTMLNYNPESDKENIPYLIAQQNWSQLAQMGSPAVAPLIECMEDYQIASEAWDALVKIGEPAVIPLIAYLKKNQKVQPQLTPRKNRRNRLSQNRRSFRLTVPTDSQSGIFRPDLAIEALGEIGDSRALDPLLEYMENSGKSPPPSVAEALGRLGDMRAAEPLIERLDQTRSGAASALALTQIMGEKSLEHVVPLLPKWGAYNELISAISKLGWKPQTEAEHVYAWAATNNKGEMLANWEQTKRILLSDLKNEYKSLRAVAVFLLLEKDDPAVISSLLELLRTGGSTSESAAYEYLNCGHARLIDAAANWFVNKGDKVSYMVSTVDKDGHIITSQSYDKETTPPDVWQRILRENHTWK
jgi:HEAT repeat protein